MLSFILLGDLPPLAVAAKFQRHISNFLTLVMFQNAIEYLLILFTIDLDFDCIQTLLLNGGFAHTLAIAKINFCGGKLCFQFSESHCFGILSFLRTSKITGIANLL